MENLMNGFDAETLSLIDLLIDNGNMSVVVEWIQDIIWNGNFSQCCDIDNITANEIINNFN